MFEFLVDDAETEYELTWHGGPLGSVLIIENTLVHFGDSEIRLQATIVHQETGKVITLVASTVAELAEESSKSALALDRDAYSDKYITNITYGKQWLRLFNEAYQTLFKVTF